MTDGKQWFVAVNGQTIGPMSQPELVQAMQSGRYAAQDYVFTEGMEGWVPASQATDLQLALTPQQAPQSPPQPAVQAGQPASAREPSPAAGVATADEVDYEILGEEMQFVEIELDPGESVVAEAGSMMFMSDGIQMRTIFGDGSGQEGGFMSKLVGAGKRLLTGESLFMTVFTHEGAGKARVGFAAPYPGKIIPMDLSKMNGQVVCQKDAFLCAAKGVSVGIAFQKKIGTGLFGGEGFIMQKLEGDGLAFVHAGGTIVERTLEAGETLRVDTGCIVALNHSISYDIEFVGGVKSAIFGGEGFFFAKLAGPGTAWLQSLPFSRLAGRVWQCAPKGGGKGKGEGSVLGKMGGIGGFFDRN